MNARPRTVLVIGATGRIGRLVVAEALDAGYAVHALVRDLRKATDLPPSAELVVGDLTAPESLMDATRDIDGVIFAHGSDSDDQRVLESVDYGGVRNVLRAIGARRVRIVQMTTVGVTERLGDYNRRSEAHDWKRRAERLVRASGHPYTIVRPGWFDHNRADEQRLVFLQGDRRHSGTPADGAVSRRHIAAVLVRALGSAGAIRKTFELVAVQGETQPDLEPSFVALDADAAGAVDGVHDMPNQPLAEEPQRFLDDLAAIRATILPGD